jgi:hypothetical protein
MKSNGLAIGPISQRTDQSQRSIGSIDRKQCFRIGALFPADGVQCAVRPEG